MKRNQWSAGAWAAFTTACMWCVASAGCTKYGPISRNAYDYATALYSVSNRQAVDKVDAIGTQIQAAREAGEISPEEAAWLDDIVGDARQGEWQLASDACREMMVEQASR